MQGATKIMHMTSQALAVGLPVALVAGNGMLSNAVDIGMGVVIPYHMHHGLNVIASDYTSSSIRPLAGGIIAFMSGVTFLGMLRINMDQGLTETVKDFLRVPAAAEERHPADPRRTAAKDAGCGGP